MSGGSSSKDTKSPNLSRQSISGDREEIIRFIKSSIQTNISKYIKQEIDKKFKAELIKYDDQQLKKTTEEKQKNLKQLKEAYKKRVRSEVENSDEVKAQITALKKQLIPKGLQVRDASQKAQEQYRLGKEGIITAAVQQKAKQNPDFISTIDTDKEELANLKERLLKEGYHSLLQKLQTQYDGREFQKNIEKILNLFTKYVMRSVLGEQIQLTSALGQRQALHQILSDAKVSYNGVQSEFQKLKQQKLILNNPVLAEDLETFRQHILGSLILEVKEKYSGGLDGISDKDIEKCRVDGMNFLGMMDFDSLIEEPVGRKKVDADSKTAGASSRVGKKQKKVLPTDLHLEPAAELKSNTNEAIADLQQQMQQVLQQVPLTNNHRVSDYLIPTININIEKILQNLKVDDEHLEAVEVTIILQHLQQSMDDLNTKLASNNPDIEDIVMMLDDIGATLAELAEGKHWGQQLEATMLDDDQDDSLVEQLQLEPTEPVLQEELSIEEREKRFLKQISGQGIVFYTSKMIEQQRLNLNVEAIKGNFEAKFQEVFNLQQSESQAKATISELAKKIFLLTNLGCEKKEILRLTQFKSISSGKFLGDSDDIRRDQLRLEKEQAFCQLKHVKQRLNLTVDDQGELFDLLQPGGTYYQEIEAQLVKEKQDRSAGSALQEKYQSILIQELSAMYRITQDPDTTIQNIIERVQKNPLISRINGSIDYLGSISQLLSFFDGKERHTRDKESRQKDPYLYKEDLEELWHPTLVDKPIVEFNTAEALQHYQLGILEQIKIEDARLLELRSKKLSTLSAIEQAIEQKECNLDIQALESLAKKLQDEIDRKRRIEDERERLQFNGQVDQLVRDEFAVRKTIEKEQTKLFAELDDISQQLNLMQEKHDRFQSKLLSSEVKARGHLIDNEDKLRKDIEELHRELLDEMQAQSELLAHEKTARQDITKNQRKAIKKLKLEWDKLQAQRNFLGDETTTRQNLFEQEETSRKAIQAPIQAQLDKIQAEEQAAKINEQHLIDAIVAEIINVVQEANQLRDKKYSAAPQVANKAKDPVPSKWAKNSWLSQIAGKGLQMIGIGSKDTPPPPQNNKAALEEISKNLLKLSNDLPHRLSNLKF